MGCFLLEESILINLTVLALTIYYNTVYYYSSTYSIIFWENFKNCYNRWIHIFLKAHICFSSKCSSGETDSWHAKSSTWSKVKAERVALLVLCLLLTAAVLIIYRLSEFASEFLFYFIFYFYIFYESGEVHIVHWPSHHVTSVF